MKINPYQSKDPLETTTLDKNNDPIQTDEPTGVDEPTDNPKVDDPTVDTEDPKQPKPTKDKVEYSVMDFDSGELDDLLKGMNDLESLDKLKELISTCANSVSSISDYIKKESQTTNEKAGDIEDLNTEIQKDLAYDGTGQGKNSAYSLDVPTGENKEEEPKDTTETDNGITEKQTKLEKLSTELEESSEKIEKTSKDLDKVNNSLNNIVSKAAEKADVKQGSLSKADAVFSLGAGQLSNKISKKLLKLLGQGEGSTIGKIAEDLMNPFGIFGDHGHEIKEKREKFKDITSSANGISKSIKENVSDLNELKNQGEEPAQTVKNTLEKIEEKEKEKEKP